MKKLKARLSLLAISLGLMTMPAYAVVNVPLVNNAWTFIGVPGFQAYGASGAASGTIWGQTDGYTIIDGAGTGLGGVDYTVAGLEVPTWDGNYSDAVDTTTLAVIDDAETGYSNNTPRATYNGSGTGSNIYGTVAVMAIGQDVTAAHSTATAHAGATLVALRVDSRSYKSTTSPIRVMYVQSPDASIPDIKVYYQANKEGENFKIQYQTSTASNTLDYANNTTYTGTFNRVYTYDNPADLGSDFPVTTTSSTAAAAGNQVKNILHAFDMNLTDNNLSSSGASMIEPNQDNSLSWTDYGDAFVSDPAHDLRMALDGNLTMLWFDTATQEWRQIRATNYSSALGHTGNPSIEIATDIPTTTAGLNDGDLEAGRGYWVKLEPDVNLGTDFVPGFVLDSSTIDHNLTSSGADGAYVNDGWNMLSFGDEYLSYSVTGMVFSTDTDVNVTDTYGAATLQFTNAAGFAPATDANGTCKYVNQSIDRNNSLGLTNIQVKCLPGQYDDFVVLVSTRRFSIQPTTGVPASLAGTPLTAESDGNYTNIYKTIYGEFALLVEPNYDFMTAAAATFAAGSGAEGNMSVEFPVNSGTVGAVYAPVTTSVAATTSGLYTAMGAASLGLTGVDYNVTGVNVYFDSNTSNGALLMASNYRFFVKDATQVRVFDYDNTLYDTNVTDGIYNQDYNVSARIKGKADATFTIVDDDLNATVSSINTQYATTGILGMMTENNTSMMIFYNGAGETDNTRAGTIDLEEWAVGYDLLTEKYAQNENNGTAKGAIAGVWQITKITEAQNDMNASGGYTGNYGSIAPNVTDLRFNAYYAQNFPIDGPLFNLKTDLGVKAEAIITGETETSGAFISWKQIDVSVPPEQWYDSDDQYELFWTEKEKGYWVYINGTATNDLSFGAPSITGSTYQHFNNKFSGSSTTGTTRNHLNKTLTVTVNNLTDGGANANTDAYEVYASVANVMTSFERDGGSGNTFSILLNSHETNGIAFDDGEITIDITAAEGSGKKVTTTYTLDYEKPDITAVTVDGTSVTTSITNADAVTLEFYNGDINDSSYGSIGSTNWAEDFTVAGEDTTVNLGTVSSLTFPTAFETNASAYILPETTLDTLAELIDEGIIRDVRIVAKDDAALYSDQERLYYLPWKSGTGVLSDSSTLGDSTYDSGPTVYTASGDANATYDGTIDDGIQLSGNGSAIACAYPHENVSYNEATAIPRTLVTAAGVTVGSVIYSPDLAGNPMVCQTGGTLYVTGLAADGEATPYTDRLILVPMSSSVSATIAKQ